MVQGDPAFEPVFQRLRGLLEPYARRMHVSADAEGVYGVDMAPESERNPTTWFGGVRRGKAYVSYYLMPIYVEPSMLDDVSPELKRRMQGKSCFNFKAIDEGLFDELEQLTRRGYDRTAGNPAGASRSARSTAWPTGRPCRRSGARPAGRPAAEDRRAATAGRWAAPKLARSAKLPA